MENNNCCNSFSFNPHRYDEHLSTYGKKVLNALVHNWKAGEDNLNHNAYRQNTTAQRCNRVLTFRDAVNSRQSPPLLMKQTNIDHESIEPFDINLMEPTLSQASTIAQLVHIVEPTNNTTFNEVNVSSNDLIYPIKYGSNNMLCKFNCTSSADLLNCQLVNKENTTNHVKINDIDWHNMFDTELLCNVAITNAEQGLRKFDDQVQNAFVKQARSEIFSENLKPHGKKRGTLLNVHQVKSYKRKYPTIKDGAPKISKKASNEAKPNFRKQKYTKAVKNWLNDPANNPEIDELSDNSEKLNKITMGKTEIIINKFKGKSNKKVIQAQLANKGGIMKYEKPKAEAKQRKENVIHIVDKNNEPDELSDEDRKNNTLPKNKAEKEFKEKINKPKFVAPIKSQIPVKDMEYKVITVNENESQDKSLINIKNKDLVAVLIYSNGFCQLNDHHTEDSCDPEGFIISIDDVFYYFKGNHEYGTKKLLESLLENNKIIGFEAKSLFIYFKSKFDLDIYKVDVFDAKIGGSLIDPDSPPEDFSELQKLLFFTPHFTIATECTLQKTAWYASLLRECGAKLIDLLKEEQLWHVFVEIEMKLLPVISEMERIGVTVDLQKLKNMEDILLTKMKSIELECHKAAGRVFQINSPVQVRALIYDELQLDTKSNVKIRETLSKGDKSTSESMLRSLVSVHPLPKLILEYRHLHKAYATFLSGVAQFVKDGVVRPSWVQTAAATGRIACNNPNLQAIPKASFNLIMFPEDNHTEERPLRFRSLFVARRGRSLAAADFRHVECRVFALAAADARLLAALAASADLFRLLAALWLQKEESAVSAQDRERTKRVVYASLYGAGPHKLMDILALSYGQARDMLASFHRTFPSLKSFGRSVSQRCVESGGRVATASGRARRLPHIAAAGAAARAHAQRQAVNFIVQGSAADLCKCAMVKTDESLRRAGTQARLVLQIHDELVWEVPDECLHTAVVIIKQEMESCGLHCGLTTTLPVSISTGKSWGDMTEYTVQ